MIVYSLSSTSLLTHSNRISPQILCLLISMADVTSSIKTLFIEIYRIRKKQMGRREELIFINDKQQMEELKKNIIH